MQKLSKQILFGTILVILSALTYTLDYIIFRDARDLFFYSLMDIAFLFIQVLLVSLIINTLMESREKQDRMEKLNTVIGVFFSEVGTELLSYLSDIDPDLETIRKDLIVSTSWTEDKFNNIIKRLNTYRYEVDQEKLNLEHISDFLKSKRDFLLIMLENPNLMEHERFTELLRSVFHLAEELKLRGTVTDLPCEDCIHIAGDINRAYGMLVREWIFYMKHLKSNFPYLFSLAMRTNPFDQTATVIVR
jgi:hypothetical protein